jgi:hypothetical protein
MKKPQPPLGHSETAFSKSPKLCLCPEVLLFDRSNGVRSTDVTRAFGFAALGEVSRKLFTPPLKPLLLWGKSVPGVVEILDTEHKPVPG